MKTEPNDMRLGNCWQRLKKPVVLYVAGDLNLLAGTVVRKKS